MEIHDGGITDCCGKWRLTLACQFPVIIWFSRMTATFISLSLFHASHFMHFRTGKFGFQQSIHGQYQCKSNRTPQIKILFRGLKKWPGFASPNSIHWCDGSEAEYQALCELMVRKRHVRQAQRTNAPDFVSRAVASQRCGARGRPDFHLLQDEGRSRADEQLGRSRRDETDDARTVQWLHEGPHDVCDSVCDGAAGFAHLQNWH